VKGTEFYAVVIVTHNHADTLPTCLSAIEKLDPAPARVVLIDNASSDGSAEIAQNLSSKTPFKVIRETSNTGFAAAVNRAIGLTSEPWVLVLNPDCAPQPEFVRCLFEELAQSRVAAEVGTITPKLLRSDGPGLEPGTTVDAAGMLVTASGRHFDRGAGRIDDGAFDRPAWVFGGTGAAAFYRREALEDVAYPGDEIFSPTFFAYREDAELAWRLQSRGWRCLYAPLAVGAHRRGFRPEDGRRGHPDVNRHSVRNRFLLRWHCADLGWHLRCLPWWLARDLMVVAACLTVERTSLPALADVWRLRGDARRRRRWVLERRTASTRHISRWFRRRGRVEEVESA
jgi:GT2 family glycosyltransferase